MPREIIHISVGQCGNQIGDVFWRRILEEHNLTNDGFFNMHDNLQYEDFYKLDKIEVYFCESEIQDKFVPRAVLIDLEPGVIDKVVNSDIGHLYNPDYILKRASGAGNNWAKGHYTIGSEVIDETMDIIRKITESCDQLQGFQLSHSIAGGTGSGFGTLIIERLKDFWPDKLVKTWSIYPTPKVSDVVVEPYNSILTIAQLMNDSDISSVSDNEAIFNISQNILKQKSPSFADLNWILSLTMSGCTASLRFSGLLNCDLRKMCVNLIPFPRLHFFTSSYSPLINAGCEYKNTDWNLKLISNNVWNKNHLLASIDDESDGKFLSSSIVYRGRNISSAEIENITKEYLNLMNDNFVEWIPHNVKTSIINCKPLYVEHTATMIANITSVKDCFQRIWESFDKLFRKKAFFHWYQGEGMHEMEFMDAEAQIKDLIMEYFEKQEIDIDYENVYLDINNIVDQYEEEEANDESEEQEEQEEQEDSNSTDDHSNIIEDENITEDQYEGGDKHEGEDQGW